MSDKELMAKVQEAKEYLEWLGYEVELKDLIRKRIILESRDENNKVIKCPTCWTEIRTLF